MTVPPGSADPGPVSPTTPPEAVDARRVVLEKAGLAARLAAERIDVTLPPPARGSYMQRAMNPDQ